MRFFVLTDLEGVAGVHSFSQTRKVELPQKEPGMRQLAREVNACVEGIRAVYPDAEVDVWDGHGSGGMFREDIVAANFIPHTERPYRDLSGYAAVLFVGQHAMVGTPFAPLCHTYSSLSVAYYRLNGMFVGEFGARAFMTGLQGVPVIFLAGDDKAAHEAQVLIPEIETAVVKWGKGFEAAESLTSEKACDCVRQGAERAVRRLSEIPPLTGIEAPFTLEIRYYEPVDPRRWQRPEVSIIDSRTVQITGQDLSTMPF
ncbi:MAG: M55 family metallopeptidase [Limnochordia bacterium]|jgi:D-amino peptidase